MLAPGPMVSPHPTLTAGAYLGLPFCPFPTPVPIGIDAANIGRWLLTEPVPVHLSHNSRRWLGVDWPVFGCALAAVHFAPIAFVIRVHSARALTSLSTHPPDH